MTKTLNAVAEIVSAAGFQLESAREQIVNDAAHAIVECLIRKALDDLSTDGYDVDNCAIETIAVEMELDSLGSEIDGYIDACDTSDEIEELYADQVRELVRQQIEEQEGEHE